MSDDDAPDLDGLLWERDRLRDALTAERAEVERLRAAVAAERKRCAEFCWANPEWEGHTLAHAIANGRH